MTKEHLTDFISGGIIFLSFTACSRNTKQISDFTAFTSLDVSFIARIICQTDFELIKVSDILLGS